MDCYILILEDLIMRLNEIFPEGLIKAKVNLNDVIFHQIGMENIEEIVKLKKLYV